MPMLCLLCLFGITRGLLQPAYAVQTGVSIANVLDEGLGLGLMLRSGLVFICRHTVFRLTLLLVTLPHCTCSGIFYALLVICWLFMQKALDL